MTFKEAFALLNMRVKLIDPAHDIDNTFLLTGIIVQKTKSGEAKHSAIIQDMRTEKTTMTVKLEDIHALQ